MRYKKLRTILVLGFWGLCCSATPMVLGQEGETAGNLGAAGTSDPTAAGDSLDKLLDLADKDLGQLSQVRVSGLTGSPSLDIPVSTVARQESTVGRSPAAVFVITQEMIRRSGAKSIPEVLRMAPGVEVAKIDSNKWAVSIRGFNGRFANKLLVQIDGRSIYTPLFAGVWWDAHDVLLEDVERIEVIRGPGASVWGANAVNGIINIITKKARDSQGMFFEGGAGTEQLGFTSVRYGGRAGQDIHYRIYGKWFERGRGWAPNNQAYDDWQQARGGFRVDWEPSSEHTLTVQGDYFNGYVGNHSIYPLFTPPFFQDLHEKTHIEGQNVLIRWRRLLDESSDWTTWVYYDRDIRHWPLFGFAQDRDTFNLDFQHRFPIGRAHDFIWGFGYRNNRVVTVNNPPISGLYPPENSFNIFSYFVQDQITLSPDLWTLTIGSKFEHNDYTQFEYQPTVRVLWTPSSRHSIWGAVSRAVRIPSLGELYNQVTRAPVTFDPVPIFPVILGNPNMQSEELLAYEAGVRVQATEAFSWDLAVFLHDYQKISTAIPGTPYWGPGPGLYVPATLENAMAGNVYGFELAANYQIRSNWRLQGTYSFLVMDLEPTGEDQDASMEGESPRNQFYLQSSWDLGRNWELDLIGRYVDNLPTFGVPSYFVGDARLCWRPRRDFELSLVGRNLLKSAHAEFGDDVYMSNPRTEVQSEFYGQIILRR